MVVVIVGWPMVMLAVVLVIVAVIVVVVVVVMCVVVLAGHVGSPVVRSRPR
jgi:hypothetical protein